MKKLVWIVLLGAMAVLSAGCGITLSCGAEDQAQPPEATAVPYDLEIREKMFLTQTNDIYTNADEYVGKVIKLEGMFLSSYYEPSDSMYYMVMRNGPGCCGNDGTVGFEVCFDESVMDMPADDDWVEAIGTLEWYEEFGQRYLHLNLVSLTVLDTRGAEMVTQ